MAQKTVLITGAAGGIGQAVVKCFADDKNFQKLVLIDQPNKREYLDVFIASLPTSIKRERFLNYCFDFSNNSLTFCQLITLKKAAMNSARLF